VSDGSSEERALSVPAGETARWRAALEARGWLGRARIREAGERRLVPIAAAAPDPLPAPFDALPVERAAAAEGPARTYVDHLRDLLPADVVERHADDWTSPHDLLGDLVIVKLNERVRPYAEAVGVALLRYRAGARLALLDEGVQGELRVRGLRPLAVRVDGEPRPVSAAPGADLSTRTRVREHGHWLEVDPAAAYYSPRLANERLGTLAAARRLRAALGRPLRVADPYAGVGPGLVPLLREPGLVGAVLAADLNADAVPLLRANVAFHGARARPPVKALDVRCADARRLADEPALRGRFDLLLVNLPHDSIAHLPDLLPLVARGQPALVRGWAIVAYDDWEAARARLRAALPAEPFPDLEVVRTYSAFQAFARFEAWLHLP
jgi:tRNA G37 N-methylase Trm5